MSIIRYSMFIGTTVRSIRGRIRTLHRAENWCTVLSEGFSIIHFTMANEAGWQSQSLPTNASGNEMIDEPPKMGAQSLQAGFRRPLKSTLTVKTHRDSLRSSWGASNKAPKSIVWRDVSVRQYEVTVGDNPSVSSGPPLR